MHRMKVAWAALEGWNWTYMCWPPTLSNKEINLNADSSWSVVVLTQNKTDRCLGTIERPLLPPPPPPPLKSHLLVRDRCPMLFRIGYCRATMTNLPAELSQFISPVNGTVLSDLGWVPGGCPNQGCMVCSLGHLENKERPCTEWAKWCLG